MPSKYDNQLRGKNCNDCCSAVVWGQIQTLIKTCCNIPSESPPIEDTYLKHPLDNRELPTVENS